MCVKGHYGVNDHERKTGEGRRLHWILALCRTEEGNNAAALATANGNVFAAGHSPGAHLAVAFATLFPTVITDAYGFNTPGFKSNSTIDNFFNVLGSTSGGPDAANTGNVTNIFAKEVITGEQKYNWIAGLHFDENPLGYTEIPIEDQHLTCEPAEESNHSIKILTDSLALYEVLTKLDPAMDFERYYGIFQRAANTPHKALKAMVDGLSALLGNWRRWFQGAVLEFSVWNSPRQRMYRQGIDCQPKGIDSQ